jgi:hypothetical protein
VAFRSSEGGYFETETRGFETETQFSETAFGAIIVRIDTHSGASKRIRRIKNMARPEVTGRKLSAAIADEVDAYSVAEFCKRHRISPQLFYKFKDQMPVTFRIGTRVLISREAAAAWRRERQANS